jgi:hypothetical protein
MEFPQHEGELVLPRRCRGCADADATDVPTGMFSVASHPAATPGRNTPSYGPIPGPFTGAPTGCCMNVSFEAGPERIEKEARTPTKTAARNTARIKEVFCICILMWDFLLTDSKYIDIMRNCIIVTSIVEISDAPLDWSAVRSIYSHKQRFEQTLETIESIRKHLPDTEIILAECSPPSNYMNELEKRVDVFINTYPNELIRNGFRKAVCEAQLLLYVFDRVDLSLYDTIFKMTGRYVLLDTFDKTKWTHNSPVGCITTHYANNMNPGNCIYTFFFKFTNKDITLLKTVFERMVSNNVPDAMEWILYQELKDRLQDVNPIGIQARWSCFDSTPCF